MAADRFLNFKPTLNGIKFDGHFIAPNEFHPGDLTEILTQSGPGIYMSVGTERAFIGAALSNATHLFLFDVDARVVHYNRVSTLLLKATQNMEHYRYLKLNPELLPAHIERLSLSPEETLRLQAIVRKPAWAQAVAATKDSTFWRPANIFGHFASANYIQDEKMFAKLKHMALNGRIQSSIADFSASENMLRLATAMEQANLKISVLDLSNVPDYVAPETVVESLKLLAPATQDDTLVVWTTLWEWNESHGWPYFWATMKELREKGLTAGHSVEDWRVHFKPVVCERLLLRR